MPVRIQRQRKAGWRMPAGARYIGRGSIYGNPFIVQQDRTYQLPWVVFWSDVGPVHSTHPTKRDAQQAAVDCFTDWASQDALDPKLWTPLHMAAHGKLRAGLRCGDLRGRDLACWCALDAPCHGDVLLPWVNGGAA